ncbi:MAG: TIGR00153 family protein [Chlamydiia bacterium]|nr:TIGR00153 family protein [Chlamydiia bacterium]
MSALARVFGRSPFAPLQAHMGKVASCVKGIVPLFEALTRKEYHSIVTLSERISKLEHEADLTKNNIRNNLPSGLFLPIARASLLEILSLQDNIADAAENVGVLLTYRHLEIDASFSDLFATFLKKNIKAVDEVHAVIKEMHELLESSFAGVEAEKVRQMVEKVALTEHEVDLLQHDLTKIIFAVGESWPHPTFYLWMKVIQEVGALSDIAEKLANRVRMTLEVKG